MSEDVRPEVARRHLPTPWRVVVGTDASPASRAAVELAAEEAWSRGTSLHVLAVTEPARGNGLDLSAVMRLRGTARVDAEAVRAAGMTAALSRCPGLEVTGAVVPATDEAGADQAVLVREELEDCALLVVGARGGRGAPAFAMGTTSGVLVTVSSCPVLVVPAVLPLPETVVGDGSPPAADARPVLACVDVRHPVPVLTAAVLEAGNRSLPLVVLHVAGGPEPVDVLRARISDLVSTVVPATTSTEVRVVAASVVTGSVATTVLEAARDAAVLVVGSRGTLALAGLALGSVSHEVLRDAPVPVLVARSEQDRSPIVPRQQAAVR